jgi:3-demethoxyubiquinol 3-hydroxylase
MRKARPPLPGIKNNAPNSAAAQMLRVDHAGEMAAVEIYKAQKMVFANCANDGKIESILAHQEKEEIAHKAQFDSILLERGIRPTIFEPIWKPLSQFLGYATAFMGTNATHACTAAVEEVIEGHYQSQEIAIGQSDDNLKQIITKFKEEEIAHKDDAINSGAKDAFGYPILSAFIKTGCKSAIAISEKI